jgi:hypothetical protein
MDRVFFTHSSTDGHLGSLHLLAAVKSASGAAAIFHHDFNSFRKGIISEEYAQGVEVNHERRKDLLLKLT